MMLNYNVRIFIGFIFTLLVVYNVNAQNPIVPNVGLNDPHIHIFNDTAYVYASHDKSIENTKFIMEDWWIWSSPDLVNWSKRSVLKPQDTYIGEPFTGCWATDVGRSNGKYYWYFSEKNQQAGVVVGDSPVGPWKDPLGKPLLSEKLTPTDEYDMAIFEEAGEHYIIFGVWDFYIARLNDDMISLAEKPKKIVIKNPRGPYNLDGKNQEKPTDDKPFVHKKKDKYYLSWGCFYAMSDNLYGPYEYVGTVINDNSFAEGYASPTWPHGFLQGRHGSFFDWNNQSYYAYCDISQTGNRWFRDTFISYVHYKDNGEMAPIRVDGIGVGQYNADQERIEAEDYFKASGVDKIEDPDQGFYIGNIEDNDFLVFPNISGLQEKKQIEFILKANNDAIIEIRRNSPSGALLSAIELKPSLNGFEKVRCALPALAAKESICMVFKGGGKDMLEIDAFKFN